MGVVDPDDRGLRPAFRFTPFPYQWEGITHIVSRPSSLMVWGLGTGKSHLAYAAATYLLGEDEVDLVLVVCESNKLVEWPPDFREHTTLSVLEYRGSPTDRLAALAEFDHQVVIGTYETIRNDAAVFEKRSRKVTDGPMLDVLAGKRILVIYDEVTRLGNRGSKIYKAQARLLRRLRKEGTVIAVGLTGTPVGRSLESVFNYMRLIAPQAMPTVKDFDETFVAFRDQFDVARRFHHINDDDRCWPDRPTFMERMKPILSVKSKRDPDVIDQFPELPDPTPIYVELPKLHREFYDVLDELADQDETWGSRRWFNLLRQVAVWPYSLTFSRGTSEDETLAQKIVAEVGEGFLESLGSAKADRIMVDVQRVVDQGDQIILFSFFGQSVLRLFSEWFDAESLPTAYFHGGLSTPQKRAVLDEFRSGEARVLLGSDAAATGLNIPEATYVGNIEPPTKWLIWDQRRGRAHRVDSDKAAVWTLDYVALDTIEEAVIGLNLLRQGWDDQIQGDAAHLLKYQSADERRAMIKEARKRAKGSAP